MQYCLRQFVYLHIFSVDLNVDIIFILMSNQTQALPQVQPQIIVNESNIQIDQAGFLYKLANQPTNLFFYALAVVMAFIIVYLIFKNQKNSKNKKEIAIIGQRGSGKTQLFIGLCGGKPFETVPSITNNICEYELGSKLYKLCDFIGDNVSKQQIFSQLPRFHTIVHTIDGTDSKKLTDVALFIYKILINKLYQKDPCNFVLFLNKQDEKGFHGYEKLTKRIEDEIETVKLSRRNQVEDAEGEEDYLKTVKARFDLKKEGIQIVMGSARLNRKALQDKLLQLCG